MQMLVISSIGTIMHDLLWDFGVNADIAVHNLRDLKVYTQAHDVDSLHCRYTCHQHGMTLYHTTDHTEAACGMYIILCT